MWYPGKRLNKITKELKTSERLRKALLKNVESLAKEINDKIDVIKLFKTVDIPTLRGQVLKAEGLSRVYKALWKGALHIVDAKGWLLNSHKYDPWSDPKIQGQGYHLDIADSSYLSFSYAAFVDYLSRVNIEVKDNLPRWIREVSDCDNFAGVMASAIQLGCIKAGKIKQAAFAVAWSGNHAYNIFWDTAGQGHIYEPQTDEIMGTLEDPVEPLLSPDRYKTRKIIFIG